MHPYSSRSFSRAAGVPAEPVPIASYARISVDRKKKQKVLNQHPENRQTAERFGYKVVCEITDNDKSVSKGNVYREGFEDLIYALAHGGRCRITGHDHVIEGVIVVEQSRLARTYGEWERFTDSLILHPERVYIQEGSEKNPYSDGFDFEGLVGMVGNKKEPKKIAFRVTRDHMARALAGTPTPGRRLFGYQKDGKRKHPKEAVHAEEMLKRARRGDSITSITRWLQHNGIKTSTGGMWRPPAVRSWLRNPKPSGMRRMNRTGWIVKDPETGQPKIGDWETYCTPEEWLVIHRRLEATKGRKWDPKTKQPGELIRPEEIGKIGKGRKYLLSGFARCGKPSEPGSTVLCNTQLTTGPHPTQRDHWQYKCPGKAQGGCNGIGRDRVALDTYVVEMLFKRIEERAKQETKPAAPPADWAGAGEFESALEARAALLKAYDGGRGGISDETFYALLPDVEKRLNEARLERDRWAMAQRRPVTLPANPRAEWERNQDLGWRQEFLADHIVSVVVMPASKGNRFCGDDYKIIWRTD
ncbi:recombinase family protein [Actinoplanes sp. NPDC049596]|uniref:recombinase family protein n=1 Tax=unclassified Actinoplanes TaxID=2626549 RepID=UPI003415E9DF